MANHHEDLEQAAVFQWASYYPVLKWMHSIPNGGKRNPREAARLKAQGVKSGISDIFLPLPRGKFYGLYVEMKRSELSGKSRVTQNQKDFIEAMREQGYRAEVCYGAKEAIDLIKEYAMI